MGGARPGRPRPPVRRPPRGFRSRGLSPARVRGSRDPAGPGGEHVVAPDGGASAAGFAPRSPARACSKSAPGADISPRCSRAGAHGSPAWRSIRELAAEAKGKLARAGLGAVELEVGDGARGWGGATYDAIVLTGSTPVLPDRFTQQLNPGGRVFAVVGEPPVMAARLVRWVAPGALAERILFETMLDAAEERRDAGAFRVLIPQLAAAELARWRADASRAPPLVVDVREPWEFALLPDRRLAVVSARRARASPATNCRASVRSCSSATTGSAASMRRCCSRAPGSRRCTTCAAAWNRGRSTSIRP